MEKLTKELEELFKKSNELEKDIRKSLGEIGFVLFINSPF